MRFPFLFSQVVALLLLCGAESGCAARGPVVQQDSKAQALVFDDVNVVSMLDAQVHPHQTVVIEKGRITRMGPHGSTPRPERALVIAGGGRYLMPGLMDMHVHLPEEAPLEEMERLLELFLVNGVTTVRSMRGAPLHRVLRDRIRAGELLLPNLYISGPAVSDALSIQQAAELVATQKAAGYDFIKLLGGFDRPAYDAMVSRARELAIPISGHVPSGVDIDAALLARQRTIEHLTGYRAAAKAGPAVLEELARRTEKAGVCNCPTLDFFAVTYAPHDTRLSQREGLGYVKPQVLEQWQKEKRSPPPPQGESLLEQNASIVSTLSATGALLLVGTDSPGTYRVPGFSYVEELQRFTSAGLSPYEALRAATRSPAECMGVADGLGAVAPGMRADLLLLERNPLEDVRNVARPAGVMVGGHWLPREELDRRLQRHAQEARVAR